MANTDIGAVSVDDITEMTNADDASSSTPGAQNTQNDTYVEESSTINSSEEATQSEQPEKEAKKESESDPDQELLKQLNDPNLPIGKVKRFKEIIQQRNQLREEIEALKSKPVEANSSQQAGTSKTENRDISKYSNDVNELAQQIGEPTFEALFEYIKDDEGNLTGYKNPADAPQTPDDLLKALYPQIEKNLLARMGMMGDIRQKQQQETESASQANTQALKQEIVESFDDDADYKQYAEILESDIKEWRDSNPNIPMDIRSHLWNYMKYGYKKVPSVEQQNLNTARKIGSGSSKALMKPRDISSLDIDDIVNM